MEFRLANLVDDSIVDGPGYRLAVFTQGCPHRCPGCHNPGTHDTQGGRVGDTDAVLRAVRANPLLSGVTLTGGEPFLQCAAMAEIARGVHKMGLHTMAYTGYTYEELLSIPEAMQVLAHLDVLVDGRFVSDERSLDIIYRGSRNQRIIDVPATLASGEVVTLDWD